MFDVEVKIAADSLEVGETYKVYSVTEDKSGFAKFLIYDEYGWSWKSAKLFKPYEYPTMTQSTRQHTRPIDDDLIVVKERWYRV